MNPLYALTLLLAAAVPASGFAATQVIKEPDVSKMATGHWVKVRVESDGVYQLTYDKLRELGFSNPEKVNVYGYDPTLLLTHDLSVMPVDLPIKQTLHTANKIVFYGKSNVDFAKELWTRFGSDYTLRGNHAIHPHSVGATYFLSDIALDSPEIARIASPQTSEITADAMTSHTALVYHEDESNNLTRGGAWFCGPGINTVNKKTTVDVALEKVAAPEARVVYQSLMAPVAENTYNFLLCTYPEGFTSENFTPYEDKGYSAPSLGSDTHVFFSHSIRYQNITVPVEAAAKTYSLDFSIHPQAAQQRRDCALDYFALLYKRTNSVDGKAQLDMWFENASAESNFALSGTGVADWIVWNVNDPANIRQYEMTAQAGSVYGKLPAATSTRPNRVVAFNPKAALPEPEIMGAALKNQNLHGYDTPDMIIVTTASLTGVADEIVQLHAKYQDLDVMVVDQQDIFNEFGSGNTSPEAVRRFFRHIFNKQNGKLKGALMLGTGSYDNARRVTPDGTNVVTFEIEDYRWCMEITKNFCNDNFYGRLGISPVKSDLWAARTPVLQLMAMKQDLPVSRIPLGTPEQIRNYYTKVEDYLKNPPKYPAWGNVVASSDYAGGSETAHFGDCEGMVSEIAGADSLITITRSASNYYRGLKAVDAISVKMQNAGLERGCMLHTYFGHGNNISMGSTEFFYTNDIALNLQTPGRYPFMYSGSCLVAEYDANPNTVVSCLLNNKNGGPVNIVASSRDVYQEMNQRLGRYFARELFAVADGEYIGNVWARAATGAITQPKLEVSRVLNHLNYNLYGDPLLPIYAPTHSVTIDKINADGSLKAMAPNTIEGTVLDLDGELDHHFSGHVTLTVYDVPVVMSNKVQTTANGHQPTFTMDSEIIGQYTGKVTDGKFKVSFNGPISVRTGGHRIQAYVYNDNALQRGYGALKGIAMNYNADEVTTPQGAPTTITALYAGSGELGERHEKKTVITANISAPRGLAQATTMISPIRLAIDGVAQINVSRMLARNDDGTYTFSFTTGEIGGGRHECLLSVLDAAGEWTEASIEFSIDNSPKAMLSAAVESGKVNLEMISAATEVTETVLYVEHLDGTPACEPKKNPQFPMELTLPAGLYRAFVQIRGEQSVTATPKVDLFVD